MATGLVKKVKQENAADTASRSSGLTDRRSRGAVPHPVSSNHITLRKIEPGQIRVSQSENKYEKEADRLAEQVLRMPDLRTTRVEDGFSLSKKVKPVAMAPGLKQSPINPKATESDRNYAIRSSFAGGRPLPESVRSSFEQRFSHDFGKVRVHVGPLAAASAKAVNARAYTVGRHVVFGHGEYAPRTTTGRRLLAHELVHVAQQSAKETLSGIQRAPLPDPPTVGEVPTSEKLDSELVIGIIDTQVAILDGWEGALKNFDKVLTSASDKSTETNFKAVIGSFFKDKLMGELISRSKVTGAGDAFALLKGIEQEAQRAATAKESATLRDFVVEHRKAITSLKQTVKADKDDFLARVRLTKERAMKAGSEKAWNEYGLMRVHLEQMLDRLDFRLKLSGPEDLFMELSQEWIRRHTITAWTGATSSGLIVIHIEDDFSVRNAEIIGPGGQKIAEQMLRDSPEGVDVFNIKVPRRILYYRKGKSLPNAIVRLDENNNRMNTGTKSEGNYMPVYRALMRRGLPPTKRLSGGRSPR